MTLIIYERSQFRGRHHHLYDASVNDLKSWAGKIGSIQIMTGRYQFYEQLSLGGPSITLTRGSYPDLSNISGNWHHRIRSMRRISSSNLVTPGIILFDGKNFEGDHKHIIDVDDTILKEDDWDRRTESIIVRTGYWKISYSTIRPRKTYTNIIGPGLYPDAQAFGLRHNQISRVESANDQAPPRASMSLREWETVLFSQPNREGEHKHIIGFSPQTLKNDEWQDKTRSLLIVRGEDWTFFEHDNFKGREITLPPGTWGTFDGQAQRRVDYPIDRISSIRHTPTRTMIEQQYDSLGGRNGFLGAEIGSEELLEDEVGMRQRYQHGYIYWHLETGAWEVHGAILQHWLGMGAEQSKLGYPISNEGASVDGASRYSHFQNGSLYWRAGVGVYLIEGRTWEKWKSMGFEAGPMGYPIGSERDRPDNLKVQNFQHGHIIRRIRSVPPFSIFVQNMALLGPIYNGLNRLEALQALIAYLKNTSYDFVGICEMQDNDERRKVIDRLKDKFPYSYEGPDEADIEEDGGLLLLSKYQIGVRYQTIFRQASGIDAVANKGVLHARILPDGFPNAVDLFMTHTQNPSETGPEQDRDVVQAQLMHLESFARSIQVADVPCFIMGDINTTMLRPRLKADLMRRLGHPRDAWLESGDIKNYPRGITSDRAKSFSPDSPLRPINDPERHQFGSRIDLILLWNAMNIWPEFNHTEIVLKQTYSGRDMSDHYGIRTFISKLEEFEVQINRSIKKVVVALAGFHVMEETDELGDDEVKFYMEIKAATGYKANAQTKEFKNLESGDIKNLSPALVLQSPNPGAWLEISVKGKEQDDWPNSDDDMGTGRKRISKEQLEQQLGLTRRYVLTRLTKDGGEYAVAVNITVS